MAPRKFNDLRHLGLGDLIGENTANSDTVAMDMQHYLYRLVSPLVEKALQYVNDKLHGRVIVIEQENLVQARPLGFRP